MNLKIGWFGYGGSMHTVDSIRKNLPFDMHLSTCSEWKGADVKYDRKSIFSFIESMDIIVLPSEYLLRPAKGMNRLAIAWSLKKPCVISPLPAYLKYAVDGENALIVPASGNDAMSTEGAIEAFTKLRDKALREKLGINGFNTVFEALNPKTLVDKLIGGVQSLGHHVKNPWPPETFVQVIIPHYSDRTDYLKQAVLSCHRSIGPERKILIVSSSKVRPDLEKLDINGIAEMYHSANRLTFSQANNMGFMLANTKTTHFLLLNDDTIMSRNALGRMFEALGNRQDIILNPYSNCDKGWLHNDPIVADGVDLHPGMSMDGLSSTTIAAIEQLDPSQDTSFIEAPFCAMYCTLIPKEAIGRIGHLSTEYKNGGEDADFCYRAKKMGYHTMWTKGAFVFHFGGKTRKFSQDENPAAHIEEDNYNNSLLRKKWGKPDRKRIAIWTGPAWEKWDLNSYRTTGIGGSETCAGRLAETIAEEGYSVTLYGAHEECEQNGVRLIPWTMFQPDQEYFDLFIASRNINCIDGRLKAKRIVVWIHDIWLLSGQHISDYHRSRIDKFMCLSPWHKSFVMDYHELPDDKISIIPNGVNIELPGFSLSLAEKISKVEWGRLHWSSSPDRGLDNVLYLMPWIIDKCPQLKLHVFYGFYNWVSAAKQRNNEHELKHIEELQKQIKSLGDSVIFHDRIGQEQLSYEWAKAWLLLYPTMFTETYMITAREAQAAYCPIVSSNVAALDTTVGGYGHLVHSHPYSKEGREEFLAKTIELYHNKDKWIEMASLSHKAVEDFDYSWRNIWRSYWKNYI